LSRKKKLISVVELSEKNIDNSFFNDFLAEEPSEGLLPLETVNNESNNATLQIVTPLRTSKPLLTIGICSTTTNIEALDRVKAQLLPQITDDVEVIISINPNTTKGEKKNEVIKAATGLYVSFIEQFDDISPSYVKSLTDKIRSSPGATSIAFKGKTYYEEKKKVIDQWTISNLAYGYLKDNVSRFPCCGINPVLTSIAKNIIYPFVNDEENAGFADKFFTKNTHEVFLDEYLYTINFSTKKRR